MELVRPVFLLCFLLIREGKFEFEKWAVKTYIHLNFVQVHNELVIGIWLFWTWNIGNSDTILEIYIWNMSTWIGR